MTDTVGEPAGGYNLFGRDATGYTAGRPDYPQALFDALVARTGLGAGTRLLEIGPGTGQATRRLLGLGVASLTAVEPDPRMAAALADTIDPAAAARLQLVVSRFESAPLPPGSFDMAVAASSFHWVEPRTGLPRVRALLKPGGHFAPWWNVFHDMSGATAWSRAIRPLFDGLVMPPSFVGSRHYSLEVDARITELSDAGFVDIEHRLFRQPILLTAASVRAFYASFSPVLRLAEPARAAWLDRIAAIVDRDFGGSVDHELLTAFYACRTR